MDCRWACVAHNKEVLKRCPGPCFDAVAGADSEAGVPLDDGVCTHYASKIDSKGTAYCGDALAKYTKGGTDYSVRVGATTG